nr:adenylyl-sulfate kinase [Zhihengliuella flava]
MGYIEALASGWLNQNCFEDALTRVSEALEISISDVTVVDAEGVPVARLSPDLPRFRALSQHSSRPFERLLAYRSPRESFTGTRTAFVTGLLSEATIDYLRTASSQAPLNLFVVAGGSNTDGLVRAALEATRGLTNVGVYWLPLVWDDSEFTQTLLNDHLRECEVVSLPETDATIPDRVAAAYHLPTDSGLPGTVALFTGLSGSGKSTIARALVERIVENGTRSVTTLDGDIVRRNLSAGLTFSKEDRERNIRRIGWVGAEITRHGGLAVCSPIAPFAGTRQDVREMVSDAGGTFVLIHVATPLEECERRDRKGLYAKAREGLIPSFTGISSPYEEPLDADLRIDTTGRPLAECVDEVENLLIERGILPTDFQ